MLFNKDYSERRIVNRGIAAAYSLITAVLATSYLIEVIKGTRTILYFASFITLLAVPAIANLLCQKKNPETNVTKYILPLGYLLLYTFALFTGNTTATYIYIIPMLIIFPLLHDWKYTTVYGCLVFGLNIGFVIYYLSKGLEVKTIDIEIHLLAMLLILLYAGVTAWIDAAMSKRKMDKIATSSEENERILFNMQKMICQISEETVKLSEKTGELSRATDTSNESMEQVCSGTTQTADAIQEELQRIDEMGKELEIINEYISNFHNTLRSTIEKISVGSNNVEKLKNVSLLTFNTTQKTMTAMDILKQKIDAITSVTNLIEEISEQTNLLSLNASIEAAKAGQSGKGFAVVAEEIRALSEQTNDSLSRIRDEVAAISDSSLQVSKDMISLSQMFTEQNKASEETENAFRQIRGAAEEMEEEYVQITHSTKTILNTKGQIVDNISSVSAATEEVTANAQNVEELNERNLKTLEDIRWEINALTELTKG